MVVIAFVGWLNDVIAILGLVIGIGGFGYTIYQVMKTQRAAEAARAAAEKAVEESRKKLLAFFTGNAHRLTSEVRSYVQGTNWHAASLRANDLADELAQLEIADGEWLERISELRMFAHSFMEKADGKARRVIARDW